MKEKRPMVREHNESFPFSVEVSFMLIDKIRAYRTATLSTS
jgi:hypothetical protein